MTSITYRTDDLSKWGLGKGSNLTAAEFDLNFWDHDARIAMLEHHPHEGLGIDTIEVHGDQMSFVMTDSTIRGPFTLPTADISFRGDWAPSTIYFENDWVTANGALYMVLLDHTSDTSFDPNATDGHGHNLYGLLLQFEGALPSGGATGQLLIKASSADFAATWGYTPLETLSDVSLGSPLDSGDLLRYNGSAWSNWTPSWTFDQISDIDLGSPLASGDYLKYNGAFWINYAQLPVDRRNATITALAASGGASLDPTLGDVFTLTPTADESITPTSAPAGALVTIIITTSGTTPYVISFAGGFYTSGPINTGNFSGDIITICFRGDGTYLNELGRWRTPRTVALAASGGATLDANESETFTLTPTASQNIAAASSPQAGKLITIVMTTSGTSNYVQTFTSNFKTTGTLSTGTVSGKVFTITFRSDGTNLNEVSRTTAM